MGWRLHDWIAGACVVMLTSGSVQAQCPPGPVGVTVDGSGQSRVFTVVSVAEALQEADESRALAAAEARIKARALLLKDARVPKADNGRLRGVSEVERCHNGAEVYVTLKLDEANMRRALQMEGMILDSIGRSPALPR